MVTILLNSVNVNEFGRQICCHMQPYWHTKQGTKKFCIAEHFTTNFIIVCLKIKEMWALKLFFRDPVHDKWNTLWSSSFATFSVLLLQTPSWVQSFGLGSVCPCLILLTKLHTHMNNTCNCMFVCVWVFTFIDSRRDNKPFWT